MNAFIQLHGELALFFQKHILSVSKRAQGHMIDGGLEGSCGGPGKEQSYEGIQSKGGGGLRLLHMSSVSSFCGSVMVAFRFIPAVDIGGLRCGLKGIV
ncbi:hypothetical protein PAECIP112173_04960 [Paenibacillus sp. JJ-100]|nr:hypothetical protein PAECIP112173_04960 [Paenibacillus sp. JJ-100]